jgi:hypothetical protein
VALARVTFFPPLVSFVTRAFALAQEHT